MVDTRLHIDTGIDLSGVPGALPILGPWPKLGGRLFAAYMLGNKYAQWSRVPNAAAQGAKLDWSGNGRHVLSFNLVASFVGDYWLGCAPTNTEANTPFSLADIWAANSAFSVVVLAKSNASTGTTALVRSDPADAVNYFELNFVSATDDLRVRCITSSVATTAQIDDIAAEKPNVSLYGGVITQPKRTAWAKTGTSATKEAVLSTAIGPVTSSVLLEFGDGPGSPGVTPPDMNMFGFAIYNNVITQAEFDSILIRQRNFHTAIGSGVPV